MFVGTERLPPRRWATSECPYSCNSTQKKRATTMPMVTSALRALPESLKPTYPKNARSRKKLQWTFTSMPKARPILKDPPIYESLPHPPAGDVIRNPLSLLESRGGGTHSGLPSRYDRGRPFRRREDSAKRRSHRRGHRDHSPLPPRRRDAPSPARHPRGDF